MADYRDHYDAIRAAGADLVLFSVDPPAKTAALRRALNLPFTILSDVDRHLARDWDLYNARERGGIARPALLVIDRDRRVRFSQIDSVATRVPASQVVRLLRAPTGDRRVERKVYIPTPADLVRAIRNARG